jgi:hypothetical protein
VTGKSFYEEFFMLHWRRTRIPEPQIIPRDMRYALNMIQEVAGISIQELAHRLGVPSYNMNAMQARGKPVTREQCMILYRIALDFGYPRLADFFEVEGLARKEGSSRKIKLESRN